MYRAAFEDIRTILSNIMTEVYTLNTGTPGVETSRLNFQHNVFLKMTGTLLPPHIMDSLTAPDLKIADVACGTAVWLKALAAQFPPTATLHGFDMFTANFPEKSSLPANAQLFPQNALEPFPEACLGAYDLVHVRLLMYAFKSDEWVTAIRNLMTILKPGGWLIWEETGYTSWVTMPPSRAWYAALEKDMEFAIKSGRDVK
jgi:ubiquinone/menaquinone biosynthesis C-methylase UbiE